MDVITQTLERSTLGDADRSLNLAAFTLLHELGHAVAARRTGADAGFLSRGLEEENEVRDVTLRLDNTLLLPRGLKFGFGVQHTDHRITYDRVEQQGDSILGSLERFIGILIEHYAGAMPVWLAPVQAKVMNITDKQADYVKKVAKSLNDQGFRVETDLRNEKIGFKIREHTLQRVPYLLVVGDREMETGSVAVRTRAGEDLGSMPLEVFAEKLAEAVATRS